MGGVGSVLKWVALVVAEQTPGWCTRQYHGWRNIYQNFSENSQEINIVQSLPYQIGRIARTIARKGRKRIRKKLEKEFKFQVIYTSNISHFLKFPLDIWIWSYFKVVSGTDSKLWPESCQFTLCKLPQHIKIPDTIKIVVYLERESYSENHGTLEKFAQKSQLSLTLPFKN